MVFSSTLFLFLFLPTVLAGCYLLILPVMLGYRARPWLGLSNGFLLAASLLFYFWGEGYRIWLLVAVILANFACGRLLTVGTSGLLSPGGSRSLGQKLVLAGAVLSNLTLLGYFKYFNFGLETLNHLATALGSQPTTWLEGFRVALPLGISFFVFQALSYTIDVYRGQVAAAKNLVDFACYISLFPQLVAGPIVRYVDVARQIVDRTITRSRVADGIARFIAGLGKKVLIANTLAVVADKMFSLSATELTTGAAWLGIVCYTLQIYFDFSGYSDMAIGMGRMLGFEFLENFNYPYIATSIQEFWRRWHISLSSWFRDYLYIPLGGSRCGTGRTYFNLCLVFLLCGLWHGANWTFIAWGLYHGLFLVLERTAWGAWIARRPAVVRHTYTLLAVMCGWVVFRVSSLTEAGSYLGAMFGFGAGWWGFDAAWYLTTDVCLALTAGVLFAMPVVPTLAAWKEHLLRGGTRTTLGQEVAVGLGRLASLSAILWLSCLSLAAGTHNPFIYFRF
jgi:alginate O-acetyltransferase complex protein AlgI